MMQFRRWQFPFLTLAEAKKFVAEASRDSGKQAFATKVTYPVTVYKVFATEADHQKYLRAKTKKFDR